MSKIRIKNFGPIKDGFDAGDGFMDVAKVTVFIGNQGAGKSTVAKLISTFTWIEKKLYREDVNENFITESFMNDRFAYHRVKNYFPGIIANTEIEYIGLACSIYIKNGKWNVVKNENPNGYRVPKIMYVPAERNFLSSVEDADGVSGLPKPLYTFQEEYERSKRELSDVLALPVDNIKFEYNKAYRSSYIKTDDYRIPLEEASSGLQSLVPLFLVSKNLASSINKEKDPSKNNLDFIKEMRLQEEIQKVLLNDKLSDDLKQAALEIISSKYKNNCFINIVEEPEQNLFPTSQRKMLESLIGFANMHEGNKLIMTIHSPYIINYLSIAIQGHYLLGKIKRAKRDDLLNRLEEIVPAASCIDAKDVIIYQVDEKGAIKRLPDYEGIPSDKNYLNNSLAEGNQLFGSLFEIEEEL